jgi:molybdopterin guanine dinucleotide-containing S/N-oxide reductase-like protein
MSEQVFTQCTGGGPVLVYVKNGKISRIRPITFNDSDAPPFKIEARGITYVPERKANLSPFALTERTKIYSEERLKYPMMRVDFDPNGERHPENRGKSAFKRISWAEALDVVVSEIKRVRAKYGPEALLPMRSSHHNWGLIHYSRGAMGRFFETLGCTYMFDNPDSWEGWHWGAVHNWGNFWRLGHLEQYGLLEDGLKNCEMVIHWGDDPDTAGKGYAGLDTTNWRLLLRDMGVKQIFIDPFLNYTAAAVGGKWLGPRPNTDAALAEAIAYVWIKEDTYDKGFVEKRTLGFEEFKKQVLGETDGIARTPEWAAEITGIPAHVITALAREWASKRTSLAAGSKGGASTACRAAYGTEYARMLILLMAMQGLGKPGVNIWSGCAYGAPFDFSFKFPGYGSGGKDVFSIVSKNQPVNPVTQRVYRLLVPEAILNPPIHWLGEGFCAKSIDQQFIPYTYPEPGKSEIKMIYRYGGSFIGTMTETSRWVQMYQSPKLEFVINQDCWWNTETKFADIILPACTNFERNDISEWGAAGGYGANYTGQNHRVIVYQKKCIEPLWESRADYDIFVELAERLGFRDLYDEGNTEEDWIKKMYAWSDMPKVMSYEDFKEKGYYVVPAAKKNPPVSLRWFNEGRACDTDDIYNPKRKTDHPEELATYSGKLEFVSQSLLKHFPDDKERPVISHYIPSWEGHESELANKYPLQLITPHCRYSYHTHYDNHTPWLNEIRGHRIIKNGYNWWVVRVHPKDALERGINDGDIINVYNDRGGVLGITQVTERVRPGTVHSYQASSKYDPIEPGNPHSIDRGGCMNLITPSRMVSKNAPGMAPNSCLVELKKWEV